MPSLSDLLGASAGGGDIKLLQAKVTAVGTGTATIHFGDVTETISGVRRLASADVRTDDAVWVLRTGGVLIVIGRLSDTGGAEVYSGPSPAYGTNYAEWTPTSRSYTVAGNYALLADATNTFVNAPTNGNVHLRIANTDIAWASNTAPNQGLNIATGMFLRTRGATGWYNQDYGGGWFMSDTSWVRSYADKGVYTGGEIRSGQVSETAVQAVSGKTYGATGARGGEGVIGTWTGGHASFGRYGTVSLSGGNPFGYMMRNDGWCWIGATTMLSFRLDGYDHFTFKNVGGVPEFKIIGCPAIAGNTATINTSSWQVGYSSSSKRYKIIKGDLDAATKDDTGKPILDHANPTLTSFKPIRYHWNDKVMNAAEVNPLYPKGIAGFIAEDIHAVAPDAVTLDAEKRPTGLDTNAMLAYLTGAIQHCHRGGHKRLDRLNALEGPGGRLEQIEARIAAIEATKTVAKDLGRIL